MRLASTTFKEAGRKFPKGTVLFKEGDTGTEMYLINSGEVRLSRKTSHGNVVLATLGFMPDFQLINIGGFHRARNKVQVLCTVICARA